MPITFSSQDTKLALFPHTDAMVITVHIDRWDITRILVDIGSQAEILFLIAFDKMGFEPVRVNTLPVSFGTPKNPSHRVHNF
jgi:hypothetical protein